MFLSQIFMESEAEVDLLKDILKAILKFFPQAILSSEKHSIWHLCSMQTSLLLTNKPATVAPLYSRFYVFTKQKWMQVFLSTQSLHWVLYSGLTFCVQEAEEMIMLCYA